MAKPIPKVGQNVQYVDENEFHHAAIVTSHLGDSRVNITVFPVGGGTQGLADVPHAYDNQDAGRYWKSVK